MEWIRNNGCVDSFLSFTSKSCVCCFWYDLVRLLEWHVAFDIARGAWIHFRNCARASKLNFILRATNSSSIMHRAKCEAASSTVAVAFNLSTCKSGFLELGDGAHASCYTSVEKKKMWCSACDWSTRERACIFFSKPIRFLLGQRQTYTWIFCATHMPWRLDSDYSCWLLANCTSLLSKNRVEIE